MRKKYEAMGTADCEAVCVVQMEMERPRMLEFRVLG